jgi:hypothetical protein
VTDTLGHLLGVSLGLHQPAGTHRRVAADEVLDAEPCRHRGRVLGVAGLDGTDVGALPRSDRFVGLGEPPRGLGEGLEVLRHQIRGVSSCELAIGVRPRLTLDGVAGSIDASGPLGHELPFLAA